jgi:hypothetical protein
MWRLTLAISRYFQNKAYKNIQSSKPTFGDAPMDGPTPPFA